jgi:hypothetical protein
LSRRLIECSGSRGGSEDPVRQHAAALVLGAQHVGDVGEFACLFELGEDVLFFEVFVVVLDETSNNPGARIECLSRILLAGLNAADPFSIDQQDALEHSMLAHQVLGWSNRHLLC